MAFSLDPRQRVLADGQGGMTYAAAARRYTVSAAWARTPYGRFREAGAVAARSRATRRSPPHARHQAAPRAAVAAKPGRTREELRQHLGLEVGIATPWHALRAPGISLERSPPGRPGRGGRAPGPGGPSGPPGRPAPTRAGSPSWARRG